MVRLGVSGKVLGSLCIALTFTSISSAYILKTKPLLLRGSQAWRRTPQNKVRHGTALRLAAKQLNVQDNDAGLRGTNSERQTFTPAQIREVTTGLRANCSPIEMRRMDAMLQALPDEQSPTRVTASQKLPVDFPGGAFVRIGPNPRPNSAVSGFLDGDGMLHCVVVPPIGKRGEAGREGWYSRAWVRTAGFVKEEERGEVFRGTISQAPRGLPMLGAMFENFLRAGQLTKDTCNTAVQWHGGRLLALMEQCLPSEISISRGGSIRTRQPASTLGGALQVSDSIVGGALAAHSKEDPETGERMSFTYDVQAPSVRHDVFARDGSLAHSVEVPLPVGVMVHDLAITPRFSVLLDFPLTFRLERLLRDQFPFAFESYGSARIGLLPRRGEPDEVRWFDVSPAVCLHTINAFERADGTVVVQGLRAVPSGPASYLSEFTPNFPYEWVLDLGSGTCLQERCLSATPGEFPNLHPSFVGKPARFAYALTPRCAGPVTAYGGKSEGVLWQGVVKYDLEQGGVAQEWVAPADEVLAAEPTFVPKERAAGSTQVVGEEDGYLAVLTTRVDMFGRRGPSSFHILDAAEIHRGPVATVPLPASIPFGLHSAFVPWDALE